MSFKADNRAYEDWLRKQCTVVEADLDYKHRRMCKNAFVFLRATFFRWARRIEAVCPELAGAPAVLSVGDLHVENFGTWRDAEGRLLWGVNDFDEAAEIPYPFDLVRLATSARLIPKSGMRTREVTRAILDGYLKGLADPRPVLLDEQETWMRPLVACSDKERNHFWHGIEKLPPVAPPDKAPHGLLHSLPPGAVRPHFATRIAGGGSLGRPRYVAVAESCGGRVAREAKALVPSGWDWAHDRVGPSRFLDLARGAFRAPDPFLDIRDKFVVRRIAADSRKVELGDDPSVSRALLAAMGFDLGAIHAADPRCDKVRADVARRATDWLQKPTGAAMAAVEADYAEWTS